MQVKRRVSLLFKTAVVVVVCVAIAACGNDEAAQQSDTQESQPAEQEQGEKVAISRNVASIESKTVLIMGTGGVSGIYYPVGGVICRLLNRDSASHGIRCAVESTGGSIDNLRRLRARDYELVVAQSDWQFHAFNGTSTFEKDSPDTELRSVLALESDPIALIVRADSAAATIADLEGQRVSLGYDRSLQHRIIRHLFEIMEFEESQFSEVVRLRDEKQIPALCEGNIEAALLMSSALDDYLANPDCEVKFLGIDPSLTKKLSAKYPFYRQGLIVPSRYGMSGDVVKSLGLGATFVTQESVPAKAIYYIVKSVVDNFADFQALHPSLATLTLRELPSAGLSAPLHPGAARYFDELRIR